MSILRDILRAKDAEVAHRRSQHPLAEIKQRVLDAPPVRSLRDALNRSAFSLIAEIKAKSPSSGTMDRDNVNRAPKVYENTPAVSAISVLTHEKYFGGSLGRLWQERQGSTKPLLRKDFITDEYQVWEARAFGADAILLMASLFTDDGGRERLRDLFCLAKSLGMDALVEIGMSDTPVDKMAALVPEEAEIWGANCRKFHGTPFQVRTTASRLLRRDFTTASSRHDKLRKVIPSGKLAVAESGIHDPSDLRELRNMGYRAALIGTAFLKRGSVVEDVVGSFAAVVHTLA